MLYPKICYSGKEKEEGEIKERMSPQDKVERVLKEIHVTFSKSEMVDGHPDKVIIDRKKFLNLLDRLNQGIYDMMDQYEQTRQSRNNAERAFQKKGNEIIEAANANAEDVYAASVIYMVILHQSKSGRSICKNNACQALFDSTSVCFSS